jgi:Cu+-exporting ATPase
MIKNQTYKGNPIYVFMMFAFSTVIQFALGWPFYVGAFKSVKNGAANMDVLVVLGTTAAWLYGFSLIFIGHEMLAVKTEKSTEHTMDTYMSPINTESDGISPEHLMMDVMMHTHNFEMSSTLSLIILLGKFLEALSKKQTVDKLS